MLNYDFRTSIISNMPTGKTVYIFNVNLFQYKHIWSKGYFWRKL